MRTFAQRSAFTRALLTDPDSEITWKEFATYGYYWIRYETAKSRRAKARRNVEKYADKLNKDIKIFALRKSMKDL